MSSLLPLARRLAAEGVIVFAYDQRGYGQSEGDKDPSATATDVSAALGFLKARGNAPVAVVGVEGGGTASVIAAADNADVNALALIGSGPTFGSLNATDAAHKLHIDTVVFSSGADGGDQLVQLIEGAELRQSPQPRDPATDEALQAELVAFVTKSLGLSPE
jgi:pimeloyl-ACP methyl ester carboxylesterase